MKSSLLIIFALYFATIFANKNADSRHLPLEYRKIYVGIENVNNIDLFKAQNKSSLSKIAWIIR